MRALKVSAVILSGMVCASAAIAAPTGGYRATPYDGSSFTSACVGRNFQGLGFGSGLGLDLSTRSLFDGGSGPADCQSSTSSGVGTVNSSASDGGSIGGLGGTFNGTASGEATANVIKLQASLEANNTQNFSGASANGGWNDEITITGGTGQGVWRPLIDVSGLLDAPGNRIAAVFELMPYLNGGTISTFPAIEKAARDEHRAINSVANGDILSASSFEYSAWAAVNSGPGDPLTQLVVNVMHQLVIPFTYGVPFDLGIYANAMVVEASQGFGDGAGTALFQNTITWAGGGDVRSWDAVNGLGAVSTNFTITSASGLDYSQSFAESVPAPGAILLLTFGLIGGCSLRRRAA